MQSTWPKGRGGKQYFHYRCQTHARDGGRPPCRVNDRAKGLRSYVSSEEVDCLVWDLVDSMLADPMLLDAAIGAQLTKEREFAPVLDERLKRHETRLQKAEKALGTVRHMRYTGEIDAETFKQDREHYEREIDMLSSELARMLAAAEERQRQVATAKEMRDISLQWTTIRDQLTEPEKRQIVEALVHNVTISRGKDGGLMSRLFGGWTHLGQFVLSGKVVSRCGSSDVGACPSFFANTPAP